MVALAAGAGRVVQGIRVPHPCGDPRIPKEEDNALKMRIVKTALKALTTEVSKPTLFEPEQYSDAEQEGTHA